MKTVFIFDVDGTLTPSSQPMEAEFAQFFRHFVAKHCVYLISGSDYAKLQTQMPIDILENCKGVFGCSGSEYFEKGLAVFCKDHVFPETLRLVCERFVELSKYPVRTGTHIELRPGMLNVSVVGRGADLAQRNEYYQWDKKTGERNRFVEMLYRLPLPYEASAGGQISIDIVPAGWNKSAAKEEILIRNPGARLCFFGDRICKGGNDLPLAEALAGEGEFHQVTNVTDFQDTWRKLVALS